MTINGHPTYTARSGEMKTIDHRSVRACWATGWKQSARSTRVRWTFAIRCSSFVPFIDLDTVTQRFQLALPRSAPDMADPGFIDDASLALTIRLSATSATATAAIYVLDANDQIVAQATNGGSGAAIEVAIPAAALEELRIAGGGLENKATAQSYYDAIDPQGAKRRCASGSPPMLRPAAGDYAADSHAVT
jgi:hypothetical protein